MLIDWFTVAAQMVNFLILVVLLKKFLYGPILRAMEAREAEIAAQLAGALEKRQQAEAEEAAVHERLQELEERRQALLAEGQREAETQKNTLIEAARREVQTLRTSWATSWERERQAFSQTLKQKLGQQLFSLTRLTLKELSQSDLEQRIVQVFLEKLDTLPAAEKTAMQESLQTDSGEMVVASAFALPEEARGRIAAVVQTQFGAETRLRFEQDEALIMGIELKTTARKISWSAEQCLRHLEDRLVNDLAGFGPRGAA